MTDMTTEPTTTWHAVIETELGALTAVRDAVGLTGIYFPGHWTSPEVTAFGRVRDGGSDEVLSRTGDQLREYLVGERREFDLPLHLVGSPAARALWSLLQAIPYGETTSYGALAAQLGTGISARAVGGFVGHNPISIVVPCHRVVGSTGKLTGYAGGLERKRRLLQLESTTAGTALPLG